MLALSGSANAGGIDDAARPNKTAKTKAGIKEAVRTFKTSVRKSLTRSPQYKLNWQKLNSKSHIFFQGSLSRENYLLCPGRAQAVLSSRQAGIIHHKNLLYQDKVFSVVGLVAALIFASHLEDR